MVRLFGTQGRKIPERQWPPSIRFEVANLRRDWSLRGPVRLREVPDGRSAILATVATDVVLKPECKDIRDEEPIALVYQPGSTGVSAPAVFSDRVDFPKWLPHLNPVAEDSPASFCLAREGLQPLYERDGITGVLGRLRTWLLDAKTGNLQSDGWEPIPASAGAGVGVLDGARFQEFAKGAGDERGRAWGIAAVAENGALARIAHETLVLSDGNLERTRRAFEAHGWLNAKDSRMPPIPSSFLWQPECAVTREAVFREYRHGAEFREDMAKLGLAANLDLALGELITSQWRKNDGRPWEVVVVVGVRRPNLIVADRVGLSRDEVAGRIEVKAFLLQSPTADGLLSEHARVREIALMPELNREIFMHVSGVTPVHSPALIGCGALGGELSEFLVRMGVEGITFIDGDELLAHNVTRHVGTQGTVLNKKAVILRARALEIRSDVSGLAAFAKRVGNLDAAEQHYLAKRADFLIDATADERVRRALPSLARRLGKRVVRQELFDAGRLGVQAVEGEGGNPDLLDLYYVLCRSGLDDEAVGGWFRREQDGSAALETIAAGFSCSSPSFRMPKWRIVAHATAFMPTITALVEGRTTPAGLMLNLSSEDGRPAGARWIDVPSFDVRPSRRDGWEVRIAADVEPEIRRMASAHAPRETGGYLYGGFDLELKRITVVVATPEPHGTIGTSTALQLGRAGSTPEETRIRRRCGRRLVVVGTWHSHPGASAAMSEKDARTAAEFRRENQELGLPTLVVVSGKDALGVHVLL